MGIEVAIGVIGAAAATAVGTATVTILGVAVSISTLITAATSLLSLGAGLLFGGDRNGRAEQQREDRTRQFDPHPPIRFALGEFPHEGDVVFHYSKGQVYYLTLMLNAGRSESLDKIEINDGVELAILADAENDIADITKGAGTSTAPWAGALRFWWCDGSQTQFPSAWLTELPDLLSASDSWAGNSVLHIRMEHGNNSQAAQRWAQGKPPPLRLWGKWLKVYDPRLDTTSGVTGASGSQDRDDAATWAYSANPALHALHVARSALGLGYPDEQILIQQFATAADACDGVVTDGVRGLYATSWPSAPAAQVTGAAAGSGVWTINRGAGATATGAIDALTGLPVLRLSSADGDGTLTEAEHGRIGAYIDFAAVGLASGGTYQVTSSDTLGGTDGVSQFRVKVYQASKGGSASVADQEATFMPPDAASITEVHDSGLITFGSPGSSAFSGVSVTGDYVSVVITGGGPNAGYIEVGPRSAVVGDPAGEAAFRCDGLLTIGSRELSVLDAILATFAAKIDPTDGFLGLRAGVWVAPAHTMTEPVGEEFELLGARDEGFDYIVPKMVGRHVNYTDTDGPIYRLRDGNRGFPLQLGLVREAFQAWRLANIHAKRSAANRIAVGTWDGREIERALGEAVNFSLPGRGRAAGTYVIDSKQVIAAVEENSGFRLEIPMTLREETAAMYAYDISEYTPPDEYLPPSQTVPSIAAPTGCELTTEERTTPGEGSETQVYICQQFLPVTGADEYIVTITEAQYDTVGNENETVGPTVYSVTVPADQTVDDGGTTKLRHYFGPVVTGVQYDFSVVAGSETLGRSDTALDCSITPAPDAAPLELPTLIGSAHDGANTATHTLRQGAAGDLRQIRLYAANSADRSDLTLIQTIEATANQTIDALDTEAFAATRYLRAAVVDRWLQEGPALDFDHTPAAASGTARTLEDGTYRRLEDGTVRLLES